MNRFFPIAITCIAGVSACSHTREPTDAQLSTLLRNERSTVPHVRASLDSSAVDCLRAWSGDPELLKGLSVRFAGEDGKKACRTTLDSWIANPARNPDTFAFADVSTPKTVRRAIALQGAPAVAVPGDPANNPIPPALLRPAGQPQALRPADPSVDLGVAGAKLTEAETLCTQTQQAAAAADADARLKNFSSFCGGNLRRLRMTMEQAAHSGQSMEKLDAQATSATNIANVARNLLAGGKKT